MPAKIKTTKEQELEMLRLRIEEKLSYPEIGKRFGLNQKVVRRRIEALGVDPRELSTEYQYDKYYFYDIDTPEKAYWLGFVTADGYLNEERNHFQFHLGWKDYEHLAKFKEALQADMPIKQEIHSTTGYHIATFNVDGDVFTQCLIKNGIRQRKSVHEQPPLLVPEEYIRDYIRGLWDGDGYVSDKQIGLCSSHEMCEWVQHQLVKNCSASMGKIFYDSNVYKIYVCKGRFDVLRWLYYPGCQYMALDRKYKKARIEILRNLDKVTYKTKTKLLAV